MGDWTTFDLVKYLASYPSTQIFQEIEYLRRTPAFPKEGAGKEQADVGTSPRVQRYKATNLYEPVDIFRDLGLPVIDWGADNQWKPESDEGKFLCWVVVEGPSDQLDSQIYLFIGFEASTSLAGNSRYFHVG